MRISDWSSDVCSSDLSASTRATFAGRSGLSRYITVATTKPAAASQNAGAMKPCCANLTGPCHTESPTKTTTSRRQEKSIAPRNTHSCYTSHIKPVPNSTGPPVEKPTTLHQIDSITSRPIQPHGHYGAQYAHRAPCSEQPPHP